jgi:hypothetical protein
MQGAFEKDTQSIFHGGGSLARFLSQRRPAVAESQTSAEGSYLVGGLKALYELRAACEVFWGQIEEEFFSSEPAAKPGLPRGFLEKLDEQAPSPLPEPYH